VALNEGLRCKKRLGREAGRKQLEAFSLAPWASRRRLDLLELLDRLNPTIAELTQAVEQEAEKYPAALPFCVQSRNLTDTSRYQTETLPLVQVLVLTCM